MRPAAGTLAAGCVLTALYLVVLGSLKPLDLLVGAAVAAVALRLTRRLAADPAEGPPFHRRLVAMPGWGAALVRNVLSGTALVVRRVIRPEAGPRAGIVAIPLEERSERAAALGGLLLTLAPGEVVIDIDHERQIMWIHALDAEDPERLRERHRELYERHQRRVIP